MLVLRELGDALDRQGPLRVHNWGIVALDHVQEKDSRDAGQTPPRPPTRPRQRTAGRQGATRRPRPPRTPPRIGRTDLRAAYEGQAACLREAYPSAQMHRDEHGTWLLAESAVLPGLPHSATFLVSLPATPGLGVRSWAFWSRSDGPVWIGPRHTNFQNGSICAFAPDDDAWIEGGDLRTLLDLYSVWALRQLHLSHVGRWPGKQYALLNGHPHLQAYYRLIECRPDELCGCGSESRRYAECCQPADRKRNFTDMASIFLRHVDGGFSSRRPPAALMGFLRNRSPLPSMVDVRPELHR